MNLATDSQLKEWWTLSRCDPDPEDEIIARLIATLIWNEYLNSIPVVMPQEICARIGIPIAEVEKVLGARKHKLY